jgi:hypothetical protein
MCVYSKWGKRKQGKKEIEETKGKSTNEPPPPKKKGMEKSEGKMTSLP